MELAETEVRPETLDDFARVYFDDVNMVARQTANKFGVIDPDDVAQGVWEQVCKVFEKYLKGQDRDTVLTHLRVYASQYHSAEAASLMYFSGNYVYSPDEVRSKLATCVWEDLEKVTDVDARVDLGAAFAQLGPKQRAALYKRYGLGIRATDMSEAERKNLQRGVNAMTLWLNRKEPVAALRIDSDSDREVLEGLWNTEEV